MKLELNMYVRIQWGNGEQTISKCTNKVDMGDTQYSLNDFYIHTDKKGEVIYKSMILKASHNIIDLIEVGDYVNGQKVFDKLYDELNKCWYLKLEIGEVFGKYARTYQQHIKSIVTKEQFESMKYVVPKDSDN